MAENNDNHAFVAEIHTLGSGGHLLDVMPLTDGSVLVITEDAVLLYPDRDAFESGVRAAALRRC